MDAGEMAQPSRVLAALAEDPGSVLRAHMLAHHCNSSPSRSNTFFWPSLSPGMHIA